MLWDFLPRYNKRFVVSAVQPGSASRQPEEVFNPGGILPGILPGYQTSTAKGSVAQDQECRPGYTRHD